ncbi:MAG TPA: LysR family transcriptional regulator [Steroidobacteraceae bacterium]|jgi:DNA-binding transcriptional LysR family regulator|nr:LysR family transcriptional regulator [Steroidobacteraceae bacterium]
MELRHLKYFLAVAEELNFTRAAQRLGISQPPLTQQIKSLEAELGVALLDRSAYRIELTDAGRVFATEAARILGDARSAVQAARRAATGATGRVRVGFTESASFNPLVTATLRRFRSDYPAVEVSLEEHPSTDLIAALRAGTIDAAFVRPPLAAERGLTLDLLEKEPLVVAVPSGHPLARRRQIDLGALAGETFILYPRAVRPGLADAVVAACEAAGFTPKVGQYAPQLSSTINLVAASLGISLVPDSMRCLQAHAVTYLPLRGEPLHALLGIAYRTDAGSAVVHNFIAGAAVFSRQNTSAAAPG